MKASVEHLRTTFAFSQRRACQLIGLAVSTFRYRAIADDTALRTRLVELARERPRFGYRRLQIFLGLPETVNHKRVWRVYREAGLAVKRRKRKRLVRVGQPLQPARFPNEEWALDFVSDVIASGRRIRLLNVADAYTRECLALEVDTSFASRRVTRALEKIIAERGAPVRIRCDNVLNARSIFEFERSAARTPRGREAASTQDNQKPVVFHERRNPAQHSKHKIRADGVVFTSLETA